ncbi:hypothetical protein IWQ51_005723 [Labrenzia sp. EL_142]|nr:hypothetical protein [Labrenzia sp. EL_142]
MTPSIRVYEAFTDGTHAERLLGGMGTSWCAGNVVLKPSPGPALTRCLATTHDTLPEDPNCRFQRPVRAKSGAWEVDGWTAWCWIKGKTHPSRATETLHAARSYHRLLRNLPYDPALVGRDDPWARADRVAWDEVSADYGAPFDTLLSRLRVTPPMLDRQRVHADLTGNVVLAEGLPPGIIDPTLYWRPTALAEAIVLVDQGWFADVPDIAPFAATPALPAMIRIAARRRVAEQAEQMRSGKDRDLSVATAHRVAEWSDRVLTQLTAP